MNFFVLRLLAFAPQRNQMSEIAQKRRLKAQDVISASADVLWIFACAAEVIRIVKKLCSMVVVFTNPQNDIKIKLERTFEEGEPKSLFCKVKKRDTAEKSLFEILGPWDDKILSCQLFPMDMGCEDTIYENAKVLLRIPSFVSFRIDLERFLSGESSLKKSK